MGSALLAHLADVSIRAGLLSVLTAAVLWMARPKPGAAVRHAVWTLVLAGMLLLFVLGPVLPPLPLPVLEPGAAERIAAVPVVATLPAGIPATPVPRLPDWLAVLPFLYAAVAFVCLLRVLVGTLLIRRLLRSGRPVEDPAARGLAAALTRSPRPLLVESSAIAVPLTAGWVRPRILLPPDWRAWDKPKLAAVLTHEAAHIRRRDALVGLLAAVNRSLFWFHPLAWWIESRLALLAEQVCDDCCLSAEGGREPYARLLLDMAGVMEAAHGRVLRHAVPMAKPSHIRRRVETILNADHRPSREMARAAKVALAALALPLIYTAGALRLEPRAPLIALPFPSIAAPAHSTAAGALYTGQPRLLHLASPRKSREEFQIAAAVQNEADPRRRLALLDQWREKYPRTDFELERLQLYLNTYSQLNDVPNLLTALNQMGKESFVKALKINPDRAEVDFSPANLQPTPQVQAKVSQALFFYARAATYEGPGSLAAQGRQQLDEFLRKAYSTYYGNNQVGLNELKSLAKTMPFPPQAFLISVLPPPDRTFDSSLALASSSIRIRNKCPYGLRIDCSGPDRKRTWIPPGQDSQLVVTPGTYQIYAADARGVSSFTGPGRFDPQFDYAYTLALKRD